MNFKGQILFEVLFIKVKTFLEYILLYCILWWCIPSILKYLSLLHSRIIRIPAKKYTFKKIFVLKKFINEFIILNIYQKSNCNHTSLVNTYGPSILTFSPSSESGSATQFEIVLSWLNSPPIQARVNNY